MLPTTQWAAAMYRSLDRYRWQRTLGYCTVSAFFGPGDFWAQLLLGAISGGLVMLGPGAWSIDARLFGRKRLIREQ